MRTVHLISAVLLWFSCLNASAAEHPRKLSDLPPEAQARLQQLLSRRHQGRRDSQDQQTILPPLDGPWAQLAQPILTLNQIGYYFGNAVAVSGDTLVVTQSYSRFGPSGNAFVFVKPPDGDWNNMTSAAVLVPSDGSSDDAFGTSVAISGNTIVVGSPNTMLAICVLGKRIILDSNS